MNKRNKPERIHYDLNSFVRVDSARISRRLAVPQRVEFCLDAEALEQIEVLRGSNSRLDLSPDNLTNLRHYALLNLPLEQIANHKLQKETRPFPSLTFSTRYLSSPNQTPTTLFQSVIDLEGKISQQVRQDLIQNPLLLSKISQAHSWLVSEIISQIPLPRRIWSRLILSCLAIATLLLYFFIWYSIPLGFLGKLAVCLSIFFSSKLLFKALLIERLKSLTIYHLTEGILATTLSGKRCGLCLLVFLMRFRTKL